MINSYKEFLSFYYLHLLIFIWEFPLRKFLFSCVKAKGGHMKSLKRMNGASSIGQKATKYFAKATYCHNSNLYYDLEKSDRNSRRRIGDRVDFFFYFV